MQVLYLNGKWINLKIFLFIFILITTSYGDLVKKKTLACPTVMLIQKAMQEDMQDPLKLEMYSIAHNCIVLEKKDKIKAVGYDPRNSKEIFQKIIYQKTATELFILRSAIEIEQGGKKNTLRF